MISKRRYTPSRLIKNLKFNALNDDSKQSFKPQPVHQWNPNYCGSIDITIDRQGSWFYLGSPITKKNLIRLFASILKREANDYFLVTPVEKVKITVEDVPFIIIDHYVSEQTIHFITNVGEVVPLDKDHPLVMKQGTNNDQIPYVLLRDGLSASLHRNVFYRLMNQIEERITSQGSSFGLKSGNEFFTID